MSRSEQYWNSAGKQIYQPISRGTKNKYFVKPQEEYRCKDNKICTVVKTTTQKIDLNCVRPHRAGVIIYTYYNGSIYFGLGLDSRTHDLTDFGGQINYHIDKNVVNGSIREFEEETLNIFEKITFEDIRSCPVIYDKYNLIIFVHLNIDPDIVSKSFNKKYRSIMETNSTKNNIPEPEVCGITWLSWEEFQHSIKTKGIFYSRVRKFLSLAGDFSYLL